MLRNLHVVHARKMDREGFSYLWGPLGNYGIGTFPWNDARGHSSSVPCSKIDCEIRFPRRNLDNSDAQVPPASHPQ